MGITSVSAKNLVNRLLVREGKRHLLRKEYVDGRVIVIAPRVVAEQTPKPRPESSAKADPEEKPLAVTIPVR